MEHGPHRWAAGLLTACFLAGPALANSARTVRLVYARADGIAGCPDEQQVRDAVSERLGYDPFDNAALTVVSSRIDVDGAGLLGRVVTQDPAGATLGEREIASRDRNCAELASAMILAISLAIDPLSAIGVQPPPPPDPPPPARRPAPPPAVQKTAEPPGVPLGIGLGAGPLVTYGSTPGVTAGFAARATLRSADLSGALEGRFDLPTSESVGEAEVRARSWMSALVVCFHRRWLGLCGVLGVGRTHVTSDAEGARPVALPLAAAGPRATAELLRWGRLSLLGHADVLFSLWRPTALLGRDTAWQTAPVAPAAGLALQGRLW